MMKHAFLIMAHNNLEILQTLVSMLDDERNDIFLHIDLKSNMLANHPMSTSKGSPFCFGTSGGCALGQSQSNSN